MCMVRSVSICRRKYCLWFQVSFHSNAAPHTYMVGSQKLLIFTTWYYRNWKLLQVWVLTCHRRGWDGGVLPQISDQVYWNTHSASTHTNPFFTPFVFSWSILLLLSSGFYPYASLSPWPYYCTDTPTSLQLECFSIPQLALTPTWK